MATNVFLNTERTGYAPEQISYTLTVRELIEILGNYDEDSPVYFKNDNGYTYGGISESNIQEKYSDDDDDDDYDADDEYMYEDQP